MTARIVCLYFFILSLSRSVILKKMYKLNIITAAIFCSLIHNISGLFDPLTLTFESGFDFIKDNTYCQLTECCNKQNIPGDIQGLEEQLSKNLFGQHIVLKQLIPALEGHFSDKSISKKPLVISFHGTTGTGKTFVGNHIANSLYAKGLKSRSVHKYFGRSNFTIENNATFYIEKIDREIRASIRVCPRSLFIFDEVDGTLPGIFDFLKPLLDYNSYIDGLDITKAIFIFMSNSPGTNISDTLGNLLKDGMLRKDTKLGHFENVIETAVYSMEGGLMKSSLVQGHVIDHFIPFLPLEKFHVLQCVKQEFKHWDYKPEKETIQYVL